MDYYYNVAEEIMNVTRDYTKGSSITEVLVNRLRGGGFTEASGFPLAVDLATTKNGQIHSNVFFSAMNLFGYSLNLRPFDLAVKARAVKVLHEKGKVCWRRSDESGQEIVFSQIQERGLIGRGS